MDIRQALMDEHSKRQTTAAFQKRAREIL